MLTIETVNNAINVAQELDSSGVYLIASQGTPLARLCGLATLGINTDTGLEYTPDAVAICEASVDQTNEHAIELSAMGDDISKMVQKHLTFAKNVVKPAIEKTVALYQEKLDDYTKNIKLDLELIVVDPQEPLVCSGFESMVLEYKDQIYNPVNTWIPLSKQPTAVELIELCKTANSDLDKAVAIWSAKMGDAFFDSVATSLFSLENGKSAQQQMDDKSTGVDAAIFLFLLTNKLYNNPLEGIQLNLNKFNGIVADLRKQAAFILNKAYNKFSLNLNTKLLVLEYGLGYVKVNGCIHREWLANGGNNAAIFGSLASSTPKVFLADIIADSSRFVEICESKNKFEMNAYNAKLFITSRSILRDSLLSAAANNLSTYFGHLVVDGQQVTAQQPEYLQFISNVNTFTDKLKDTDFLNVWVLVTNAVCDCMFYYTDAKKILQGIEDAMLKNKNLTIREAITLSVIEYVTDYVADQMTITN